MATWYIFCILQEYNLCGSRLVILYPKFHEKQFWINQLFSTKEITSFMMNFLDVYLLLTQSWVTYEYRPSIFQVQFHINHIFKQLRTGLMQKTFSVYLCLLLLDVFIWQNLLISFDFGFAYWWVFDNEAHRNKVIYL